MLYLNNARVVINSVYAGIFDRFPDLKMVSVESGIGWVPFIMQAADYQGLENAPEQMAKMSRKPSETRPMVSEPNASSMQWAVRRRCHRPSAPWGAAGA